MRHGEIPGRSHQQRSRKRYSLLLEVTSKLSTAKSSGQTNASILIDISVQREWKL